MNIGSWNSFIHTYMHKEEAKNIQGKDIMLISYTLCIYSNQWAVWMFMEAWIKGGYIMDGRAGWLAGWMHWMVFDDGLQRKGEWPSIVDT